MTTYSPPLKDLHFILHHLAGLSGVAALPGNEEVSADLAEAILEEAGKFATGVLAPLNRVGDAHGCRIEDGQVRTPPGWKAAYDQFRDGGWVGLALPLELGGQGLPKMLWTAAWEMWQSANLAFTLMPQLAGGETEALLLAGSEALKTTYLPRIVSGEWSCAMNLTEPQAGSDLAAIRTRAEPQGDGTYRLFGQKIFITYGEHDLTPNTIHLVLARLPDAPPGVKGISMFLVPRFLPDAAGEPGERNDVRCIGIEHKLGIHGSPTCTMSFGELVGATGWLVGEPNRGLEYMFVMMNEARFGVGLQGVAMAEAAYQQARAWAQERVQGRDALTGESGVSIIRHPDVRRMLLTMRAQIMAARMLTLTAAGWFDHAHRNPDAEVANACRRRIDLLMPVVKAWCTEMAQTVCHLGVQIHGGMGFVEETGAAQFVRDARIITIYEGTTGIQANDLVGRKVLRENGATLRELIAEMAALAGEVREGPAEDAPLADALQAGLDDLHTSLEWILAHGKPALGEVLAGAVPFLHQMGVVCGAWQLARATVAARRQLADGAGDAAYLEGVVALARVYVTQVLPAAAAHGRTLREGGTAVQAAPDAAF